MKQRKKYVEALLQEIAMRKEETGEPIRTIYIGGGTPSTLDAKDIKRILDAIGTQDAEEITMELNPGDATPQYLSKLRQAGINRLSIGIQSFQDDLLQRLGRRHDAEQAIQTVYMAQEAGYDNISIDLMYALPTQTMAQWKADVLTALVLNVQHISTYGLMYEEGTLLTQELMDGNIEVIEEEEENAMYDYLCAQLKQAGFIHYEVSNFALPGHEAKHNSSYWDGTPYIGIGAGAHSYVARVRSWNPDALDAYIQGIQDGTLVRESETLTDKDLYNENIMLGLRTNKGVDAKQIERDVSSHIEAGLLTKTKEGRIVATQEGLHILNRIIEDLMKD